jgi:exodeoxyribonuclease-3
MKIATWNINSVRLRIETVCRFLAEAKPDVLCLQEIKCRNGEFPAKAYKQAGYRNNHVDVQKGSHGVSIVSKINLEPV